MFSETHEIQTQPLFESSLISVDVFIFICSKGVLITGSSKCKANKNCHNTMIDDVRQQIACKKMRAGDIKDCRVEITGR